MKIIPSQTKTSERRPKNLEGLRAGHTKRPEHHTAQQVSGEFPSWISHVMHLWAMALGHTRTRRS